MKNKRLLYCREIDRLFAGDARCVIIGKGKTSKAISDYLKQYTNVFEFEYVVDDQYSLTREESLSFFLKHNENSKVFFVFGLADHDRADEIAEKFLIPGKYKYFFLSFPFSFNETGEFIDTNYYEKHYEQFMCVRRMLDGYSQRLFDEYVSAQINGDEIELKKYRGEQSEQYFCEEFMPDRKVVFVDVGAYTGDTILHARKRLIISKYFALEPDKNNYFELDKLICNTKLDFDIELIKSGAYSETTELQFNMSGSSSRIVDNGDERINVIELDSLIDRIDPTNELFIKMDIEGGEKNALRGAQRLICERRPYLAICVYHCVDDLIKIPQYIEKITEGTHFKYRYGLRYYGNNFRELVLYAAPNEVK